MSERTSEHSQRVQTNRIVLGVIIFLLILTSLPYLYGSLSSPSEKQFMGLLLDVPDHGQYMSWWRGYQESNLVSNKLTPEPNEPLFFNLLWWILGKVSLITGIGFPAVFQLLRWVSGAVFLWAVYVLLRLLLREEHRIRLAFYLICCSSGLGWILVVQKYTSGRGELLYPLDIYIAEGNSFLCMLAYPHFMIAAGLIAISLGYFWRGWEEHSMRHMVTAGLTALVLGWMHAYDLILIYGIQLTFALSIWLREKRLPKILIYGGIVTFFLSSSGAIYSLILTRENPVWSEVLAQFKNAGVFTPSPLHLLILFGLPLIIALYTIVQAVAEKNWNDKFVFVVGWFCVGGLLLYIPTDFQIHMLNSWQIPMMMLVSIGVFSLGDRISQVYRKRRSRSRISNSFQISFVQIFILLAVIPTNLYLFAWRFTELSNHDYPYYLHQSELQALEWLSENTRADDVVLSSITIGQYVPGLTGNTAFLAHWAQTLDYYNKEARVLDFFDDEASPNQRLNTLDIFGVDYIFHGPAERQVGDYDPASDPILELVFEASEVGIYAVR